MLVLVGFLSAACGHLGSSLSQRELVVVFKPGTTDADREHVRSQCGSSAGVTLEPVGSQKLVAQRVYNVRYRIDHASDAELAKLLDCLSKQKSVEGYDIPEHA